MKTFSPFYPYLTVSAFTSAVLTCRKLLMHLAVEKGAQPGKSFLEYVE
jgi:hypothetical protein